MDFVGHLKGVALRLAVHAEQHRRFSVGSDDRIHRSFRWCDLGDVAEANGNAVGGSLHDDLRDLFRRAHLAADQAKHQLMVVLQQAGRIDQIGPANGIENIRDGNAGSLQAAPDRA